LEKKLRKAEYAVETAENGSEAVERISRSFFDVVLTDLMMPGIKGNELLSRAKEIYPHNNGEKIR
jgi:CheY-like chemotaxis protein